MQLEDLYRVTFTTPESWTVTRPSADGAEGQSFLIAEGRADSRLSAMVPRGELPAPSCGRCARFVPRVSETDEGATIPFHWEGLASMTPSGMRQLLVTLQHVTDDDRYAWLNDRVCTIEGEVRPRVEGNGFDVVLDVWVMAWEPIRDRNEQVAKEGALDATLTDPQPTNTENPSRQLHHPVREPASEFFERREVPCACSHFARGAGLPMLVTGFIAAPAVPDSR